MRSLLASFVVLAACAHGPVPPPESPVDAPTPAEALAVRVDLGAAMVDAHRPDAALEIVHTARAEGLEGPDLSVVQARALLARGLEGEAESLLDEVVRTYPRHAGAYATRGVLNLDRGRLDAAVADLQRATRLAPGEAQLHNNLGFVLLVAGRYGEAEPALREALRLDPSSARSRNNLGFVLAALGRTDEAREAFVAVVGVDGAERNLRVAAQLHSSPEALEAP
jgi:Flp pilus assembly protein TadD